MPCCVYCVDCASSTPTVVISVQGTECSDEQQNAAGTYTFASYNYSSSIKRCIWTFEKWIGSHRYYVNIHLNEPGKWPWTAQWEAYIKADIGYYTYNLFSSMIGQSEGSDCGGMNGYHCIDGELVFSGMTLHTSYAGGTDCIATLTTS